MSNTEPRSEEKKTPTSDRPEKAGDMPRIIFFLTLTYLLLLIALFITYVTWSAFRLRVPTSLGPLPVGAVWFAAAGAVVSSLWGIFRYNHSWKRSFDYHYYIRPLFGAVTGSIGALIYLVLLNLGSKAKVVVDRDTFYVVAFVFGYADYAFLQLVRNVTDVIIKPGASDSTEND